MSLLKMIQNKAEISKIADFRLSIPHKKIGRDQNTQQKKSRVALSASQKTAPLLLEDFVPTKEANIEVIHYGRNTLPLPNALKLLKNGSVDRSKEKEPLYGYNEGMTRPLIGPGYFVAKPCPSQWEDLGSIVIDYFEVPDEPVALGWPKVKRNNQGLQVLVYHQTRDFMRRVSAHVTIGAAYKRKASWSLLHPVPKRILTAICETFVVLLWSLYGCWLFVQPVFWTLSGPVSSFREAIYKIIFRDDGQGLFIGGGIDLIGTLWIFSNARSIF